MKSAARLTLGALLVLTACPRPVPPSEQILPPPPVPSGHIDLGPIGQVATPVTLTADPAEEYDAVPTPDGTAIAYVSHRRGNADIFVRFLPGSGRVGDYPISAHYAPDLDPTWAPTGRHLAFVSMRDDPKGDVYVYSLRSGDELKDEIRDELLRRFGDALAQAPGEHAAQLERIANFLERWEPLTRLADSETEDRSPAFSPDGALLYYTSRRPGEDERIYARDLQAGQRIKIAEPGKDPAPSPDGKYLAYATHACDSDVTGCIRVLRLSDKKSVVLDAHPGIDGFPAWAPDSHAVYFSRYSVDTNGDGGIDVSDRPALWSATFDDDVFAGKKQSLIRRLTTGQSYDLFPSVAAGSVYYARDDGRNADIVKIPAEGLFPVLDDRAERLELADALFERPQMQLLYLEDVIARSFDARFALWAARERLAMGDLDGSRRLYQRTRTESRVAGDGDSESAARVGLEHVALLAAGEDRGEQRKARAALVELSNKLARGGHPDAAAEALLIAGRNQRATGDRFEALETFSRIVHKLPEATDARAEAMLERAAVTAELGQTDRAVGLYEQTLATFGDRPLAPERRRQAASERDRLMDGLAQALGKAVEHAPHTAGLRPEDLPDTGAPTTYGERTATGIAAITVAGSANEREAIGVLRRLAETRSEHPVVPALIRNEIGDLYLRLSNPDAAISEYRSAMSEGDARQGRRARLSIARALLVKGEYEAAADELGQVASADDISTTLAARAQRARLRVLLERADEAYRAKDIRLARKAYRRVLELDASDLRGHRGLIATYAALGEADRAKRIYEDALADNPDNPTLLYATGLAYTYLEPPERWLPRARDLLERAAAENGNAVFPHQTLGFTYEKLEELKIQRGQMEKAVDQYLIAAALNDVREDARNEAALLLNAGNAFFNLKNHTRAYALYRRRARSDIPFDEPLRELVWRERFAKSAFHINRLDESVTLYDGALEFLEKLQDSDDALPPAEYLEHQTRLTDERALALAERGDSAAAAEGFLKAAELNSKLDRPQNSARALRNAAIHLFTTGSTGEEVDDETLARAVSQFERSLEGVKKHGVVEQQRDRHGLININKEIGLSEDEADDTEAAHGFSKKGEQELIWSFVSRIYNSADDPARALSALESKQKLLPAKVKKDQQASLDFKKALLENQIGVLQYRLGRTDDAWESLLDSYRRSRRVSNLVGMLVNAENLGRIAGSGSSPLRRETALALIDESTDIARQTEGIPLARHLPALMTARASLLMADTKMPSIGKNTPAEEAIRRQYEAIERAHENTRKALDGLVAALDAVDTLDPRPDEAAEWQASLLLETGTLRAGLGDLPRAEQDLGAAAQLAERSALPGLRARARLAALSVVPEAEHAALQADGDTVAARMATVLGDLEATPAPAFEPSFDPRTVEPYYRHLAAAHEDDPRALFGWIERYRALRLCLDARGAIPRPQTADAAAAYRAFTAAAARTRETAHEQRTATEDPTTPEYQAHAVAARRAQDAYAEKAEELAAYMPQLSGLLVPAPVHLDELPGDLWSDDVRVVLFERLPEGKLAVAAFRPWEEASADVFFVPPRGGEKLMRSTATSTLQRMLSNHESLDDGLQLNLEGAGRIYIVADVGLFDLDWIPAEIREAHTITFVSSLAHLAAAHRARGSFKHRRLVASEVSATRFVEEASRADVVRLDQQGHLDEADPAASWWTSGGDAAPPARRIVARRFMRAGPTPTLAVAAVRADADPETLLRLSDLWSRAGIAQTLFQGPRSAEQDHLLASADDASIPVLVRKATKSDFYPTGHSGLRPDEAEVFAAEAYDAVLTRGKMAFREQRFADSLAAFDRVLFLLDAQGTTRGKLGILRIQAMTALQIGESQRGVEYATKLVELLRTEERSGRILAEALLLQGRLLQYADKYQEAVGVLDEAVKIQERLGNRDKLQEGRTELGISLENAREFNKALTEFNRSLALSESLDDPSASGQILRKIGRIHYLYLQNNAAAEKAFQRAADRFAKVADQNPEAQRGLDEATLELGLVEERRGRVKEAARYYEKVRARAAARGDEQLEAKAVLFLANAAWFGGDYQQAFVHVRTVRRMADDLDDDRLRYLARSTEGLIQWTLNDLERALRLQNEALELAQALKSDTEIASTHNNIGLIYRSQEDFTQAVDHFEQALAIDRELGSRWGIAYDLRNLGMTYMRSADPRRARGSLEEALKLASAIGDKINAAKAALALGDLDAQLGDWTSARAYYRRARETADEVYLPEVLWRAHKGLAVTARETRDVETARTELGEAIDVVEDMRASIKIEEFKNSFITNKLDLYADAILLTLDHPPADADPAVASWEYGERARARSFIDLLANRNLALSSPKDRRLLTEQRDMKDSIFAATERIARAEDQAERGQAREELSALKEQYRDLLVEIRASNPQLSAFVTVDPPTLSQIQEVIGDDTALLEYYVTAHEVVVWTITSDSIEVHRVPVEADDLRESVQTFLAAIQDIRPVDDASRELHDLLVKPALTRATRGKRYLGIIPHGVLHYVPWMALTDGKSYLIDRYAMFSAPSAGVIPYTASKRATRKVPEKMEVLAIGNPDLGDRAFDLPFAELEVSDMRLRFDNIEILTEQRATEQWVIDNISRFRVIHFASHGEFDPVNPLFSALKLARTEHTDGDLAAHEVFGLKLRADLVTLSACQTGLATIRGGDELVGLNRAFLYAGTDSILSTLWRVSDASTAVLIKHFYRQYPQETKADALRESARIVREYYPHPAYWSAFALTGDWR